MVIRRIGLVGPFFGSIDQLRQSKMGHAVANSCGPNRPDRDQTFVWFPSGYSPSGNNVDGAWITVKHDNLFTFGFTDLGHQLVQRIVGTAMPFKAGGPFGRASQLAFRLRPTKSPDRAGRFQMLSPCSA